MELQYDATNGQPEFNEEELAALEVGEKALEEQQQLLAGKFEDAQQLEKAYIELQKKLGSQDGDADGPQETSEPDEEAEQVQQEEAPVSPAVSVITNASQEFAEKGELSPETYEQFTQMSSRDLVDAYIQVQGNLTQQQEVSDLTEQDVNAIKNFAGGEQAYDQLMDWAGDNMPQQYVDSFDNLINNGDPATIQLAVAGLMSAYEQQNGYEGQMYSGGNPTPETRDVFRSHQEVVQAMHDPRYDSDPAYRQDVFNKLERSDIQF